MQILARDGFSCRACGRTRGGNIKLTVDHHVPLAKGGNDSIGNLITLCEDCNQGKGDKIIDVTTQAKNQVIIGKKEKKNEILHLLVQYHTNITAICQNLTINPDYRSIHQSTSKEVEFELNRLKSYFELYYVGNDTILLNNILNNYKNMVHKFWAGIVDRSIRLNRDINIYSQELDQIMAILRKLVIERKIALIDTD